MNFLPKHTSNKINSTEYFIAQHFQICLFIIVDTNPKRTTVIKQTIKQFQTFSH